MDSIDLEAFTAFCKTLVGKELDVIGGKAKFSLQNISDRCFYYQISEDDVRKQNIRYVQRLLDKYAKTQSQNPGHYTHITQNAAYTLALIKMYEKEEGKE